jgi:hypothetical protein
MRQTPSGKVAKWSHRTHKTRRQFNKQFKADTVALIRSSGT